MFGVIGGGKGEGGDAVGGFVLPCMFKGFLKLERVCLQACEELEEEYKKLRSSNL